MEINVNVWRVFFLSFIYSTTMLFPSCKGSPAYSEVTRLVSDKLGSSSGYNHAVRPLLDHADVMQVNVSFDIMAIVEVDAILQKFVLNGFLTLSWVDELVVWNPASYDNTQTIHPYPKDVWRPRLVITNTMEARDLFEDKYCPIAVYETGLTEWYPGGLFPSSCKLDLHKYPFDTQSCYIQMSSMGLTGDEINFVATTGVVGQSLYKQSGEWIIESTSVFSLTTDRFSTFRVSFELKRRPGFFIVNIILPIIVTSFLNILVFVIPVDSGEKIGYGITVLLALTVFMSIVSDQLPRTSDTLPLVTIYLLVLNIISGCTVVMSIFIVYIHHKEEKETTSHKATSNFKGLFNKVNNLNQAVRTVNKINPGNQVDIPDNPGVPFDQRHNSTQMSDTTRSLYNALTAAQQTKKMVPQDVTTTMDVDEEEDGYVNRWKQLEKHLDLISFIVFTVIWVTVTIAFMAEMTR